MDAPEFRHIMGHLASGVAIVAASRPADGAPCGLTASAVTSLSLEPLLVLVCIDRVSDTHDCILDAGAFAVSVLGASHELLSRRFAEEPADDRFDGVAHRPGPSGSPVLSEAIAWIDCELDRRLDGGDHSIFIGRALAGEAPGGAPLIYFRGGYAGLAP